MQSRFLFNVIILISCSLFSQQPYTSADYVERALAEKVTSQNNSLVKNIPFKNVGPTVMSGRVVDIDVKR